MTAVRDIEQDEKPGRPVLSMRVKASVVGASFLVLLGLIACQEMPNAVQALRSMGQSATLVGNESQPPERETSPESLEQESPVQVENEPPQAPEQVGNEPPPELVEEEEPLGQETASLEEEPPAVVLFPDLVASATLRPEHQAEPAGYMKLEAMMRRTRSCRTSDLRGAGSSEEGG